jgi:hypothetical protein
MLLQGKDSALVRKIHLCNSIIKGINIIRVIAQIAIKFPISSKEYPHISLHAISKDPSAFPQECLYLMLDSRLEEPGMLYFLI